MLGQPTWYRFTRRRGHRAGIGAPRYRWTTVDYVQGWFHVGDLERAQRERKPGVTLRFLPPLHPRPLGNGGW